MRNCDKSFMNYQTITFPYDDKGHLVDVVDTGDAVDYWIYKNDSSLKMCAFGENKFPGMGLFNLQESLDNTSRVIALKAGLNLDPYVVEYDKMCRSLGAD